MPSSRSCSPALPPVYIWGSSRPLPLVLSDNQGGRRTFGTAASLSCIAASSRGRRTVLPPVYIWCSQGSLHLALFDVGVLRCLQCTSGAVRSHCPFGLCRGSAMPGACCAPRRRGARPPALLVLRPLSRVRTPARTSYQLSPLPCAACHAQISRPARRHRHARAGAPAG